MTNEELLNLMAAMIYAMPSANVEDAGLAVDASIATAATIMGRINQCAGLETPDIVLQILRTIKKDHEKNKN